MVADQVRV
jgi:BMFP domain-containing protein YqiC